MQFKTIFSLLFLVSFLMFLSSCGKDHSQKSADERASIIKETEKLDSLSTELENTSDLIEEQTKELRSALDAL